jgi:GGDEF domain-containing protein
MLQPVLGLYLNATIENSSPEGSEMTSESRMTRVQVILSKIQPLQKADGPESVRPSPETIEFAEKSAHYFGLIEDLLPRVDEATRRYLASLIHPEGTIERRGMSKNPLTGLDDKKSYLELLPRFEANRNYAIVTLDANGLKVINNELGHPYGDALLIAIARMLTVTSAEFSHSAPIRVFHLSGDEYAAFVPMTQVEIFIERFQTRLKRHMEKDKIENGRKDAQSRPEMVSTKPIRSKSYVAVGYGLSEESAEKMLKLNKDLHYRAFPMIHKLQQKVMEVMQRKANSSE